MSDPRDDRPDVVYDVSTIDDAQPDDDQARSQQKQPDEVHSGGKLADELVLVRLEFVLLFGPLTSPREEPAGTEACGGVMVPGDVVAISTGPGMETLPLAHKTLVFRQY